MIRHDQAKVSRLVTYLSWKDLRKNAKDQEGGEPELLEETDTAAASSDKKAVATKSHKVRLPWELAFMFREQPLILEDDNDETELDETEQMAHMAIQQRLQTADERTRQMTREEYVHWSECRQASFTFRKARRFRDWAGISYLTDSKPHDDIIDILGFLTFEIVAVLTEEGLKVKEQEEHEGGMGGGKKRKRKERHLFDGPDEEQKPVLARHIEEAFRRMQDLKPKVRAMRRFTGGLVSTKTKIL